MNAPKEPQSQIGAMVREAEQGYVSGGRRALSAGHSRAVRTIDEESGFRVFVKGSSSRRRYTKWV